MNKNKENINSQKYELILNLIEKILLFIISITTILIIIPQMNRYTIKDYEKFAKEYNIEYNIINCPKCGTKIPDTIQFCFNCNASLFDTDEKLNEILGAIEDNIKPSKIQIVIKMSKKVISIIILYLLLNKFLDILEKNIIDKLNTRR